MDVPSFFFMFWAWNVLKCVLKLPNVEFQKTDMNVTKKPNKKIIVRCALSNSFGNAILSSLDLNYAAYKYAVYT